MTGVVADTHAIAWFLFEPHKLSAVAKQALIDAGDCIAISAITLVELTYLVEKGRVPANVLARIAAHAEAEGGIVLAPVDAAVARAVASVPRAEVPDMPDRIIAATALHLGVPLVSRDARIRASGVQTIW